MARSQNTFRKKEREKKKQQKRKDKEEKRALKKENIKSGTLNNMIAYVDINGNFSDAPPKEGDDTMEVDASQIDVSTPKSVDMELDAERRGLVKFYNENKGFGFIVPQGSQEQYFFHESNVNGEVWDMDKVKFKLEKGEKGLNAVGVSKI